MLAAPAPHDTMAPMPAKTRPRPAVDHYEVIGVDPSAELPAIKRAYRKRSFDLHPDRNRSPEAHRQMARLNDSFAVLSDRRQREAYDATRPRHVVYAEPRPAAVVSADGPLAFQPDRLPDWYEFLDLHMNASSAEVIDALNRTGAAIRAAAYAASDEDRLRLQLKRAAETLTTPRVRAVYDRALSGTPPPAGTFPEYHENWYGYLGGRRTSSSDRLAEAVTALSAKLRRGSREYLELTTAWKVLRDPESRAAYDETIGEPLWGTAGLAPAARATAT